MGDTKSSFGTKNEPKGLNEIEAKSKFNKSILDARVRQYIYSESRLVSNMNKIYGIVW